MGCQCSKTEDVGSMSLDKSPPKTFAEEEHPQMQANPSKGKFESADASKLEASQVEDGSRVVKKKKKASKKAGNLYF